LQLESAKKEMNLNDTICAISTPSGNGAIALIRISGPETFAIVPNVFYTSKGGFQPDRESPNTVHFGKIHVNGEVIDEVLISIFKNPHSFTGEDLIELGCHGSLYIQQQILQLLIKQGARMANPGEFTQRAYLNGKMDLAQAEAVADLIAASGQASHRVAMAQMRGGISNELKHLRDRLLHFISLVELELDFSEEEVEFANREQLKQLLDEIQEVIDRLIWSFSLGNAIKNGVPVAIVGEPNVGKSTLLNAILKEDKAIVSEIAGTTRDAIEDIFNLDGITYRFIDTAGIRQTNDAIETLGIERTYQKIGQAAVVLTMFDARDEQDKIQTAIDHLKPYLANDSALIIVRNKSDLQSGITQPVDDPLIYADISVSAKTGYVDNLLQILSQMIKNRQEEVHGVVVANARHYNALMLASEALRRASQSISNNLKTDLMAMDIREVIHHLAGITGEEITTDEVLGNIFKNFCIGK
jgi:tRNA modification GTPase